MINKTRACWTGLLLTFSCAAPAATMEERMQAMEQKMQELSGRLQASEQENSRLKKLVGTKGVTQDSTAASEAKTQALQNKISALEEKLDAERKQAAKTVSKTEQAEAKGAESSSALDRISSVLDRFTLNGFATVGGGIMDTKQRTYANFKDKFSFDPDSRIGVQLTGKINDQLSATAQIVARGSEGWKPDLRWAYLNWEIDDQWKVRLGRMREAQYWYSDFQEVGFTYPWIRPPAEVYTWAGQLIDGVDVMYKTQLADWTVSLQTFYGNSDQTITAADGSIGMKLNDREVGFITRAEWDWLSLRGGFIYYEGYIGNPADETLLNNVIAAGYHNTASGLDWRQTDGKAFSFGAKIDYEDWIAMAEFVGIRPKKNLYLPGSNSWYAMAGRRFGDFTLLYTYGSLKNLPFKNLSAGIPNTDPLKSQIEATHIGYDASQHSHTVGVRWDLITNTALKLEWQNVHADSPVYNGGRDGNLFSFAIDVVY